MPADVDAVATPAGLDAGVPSRHMKRTASLCVIFALLVVPSTTHATTDRADYAAQVNSVCAAHFKQFEDTYVQITSTVRNFRRALKVVVRHQLVIYADELAQLSVIAPAAGDEVLVSTWIADRRAANTLFARSVSLEDQRAEVDRRYLKRDRRSKKLDRLQTRLERQSDRVSIKWRQAEDRVSTVARAIGAPACARS